MTRPTPPTVGYVHDWIYYMCRCLHDEAYSHYCRISAWHDILYVQVPAWRGLPPYSRICAWLDILYVQVLAWQGRPPPLGYVHDMMCYTVCAGACMTRPTCTSTRQSHRRGPTSTDWMLPSWCKLHTFYTINWNIYNLIYSISIYSILLGVNCKGVKVCQIRWVWIF